MLRSLSIAFLLALPSLAEKPNIVLINADDLGYGDLSCYGATKLKTPNIDRLAKEGRRFTDAHSPSAVCSPSRYGLLTGNYPFRINLWGPVPANQALTIDTETPTLASILKSQGYATACIGKWHLGFGEKKCDWNKPLKPGPLEIGFDYYFGMPTVNSYPPFVYVENHNVVGYDPEDPFVGGKKSVTKKYPEKGGYNSLGGAKKAHELYDDELVGTTFKDKSIEWIQQQKINQPFFLYLATTNIHHPFTPAKQFVGTSECGLYGDFVHELDWMVGEILNTLDELKIADNTLVIFTSDNGGMLHVTGQKAWEAGHRINGDLLGFKFGAWEGGHRVPMIARWPSKIPANTTSDHLISQIDFLATFAAISGMNQGQSLSPDSLNQLPTLTGTPETRIRETLIIQPNHPGHLSARHKNWVYIPQRGSGGFQGLKPGDHLFAGAPAVSYANHPHTDIKDGNYLDTAPQAQLYDLWSDPRQSVNCINLIDKSPEVIKELEAILETYRKQIPETKPIGWINLQK